MRKRPDYGYATPKDLLRPQYTEKQCGLQLLPRLPYVYLKRGSSVPLPGFAGALSLRQYSGSAERIDLRRWQPVYILNHQKVGSDAPPRLPHRRDSLPARDHCGSAPPSRGVFIVRNCVRR